MGICVTIQLSSIHSSAKWCNQILIWHSILSQLCSQVLQAQKTATAQTQANVLWKMRDRQRGLSRNMMRGQTLLVRTRCIALSLEMAVDQITKLISQYMIA